MVKKRKLTQPKQETALVEGLVSAAIAHVPGKLSYFFFAWVNGRTIGLFYNVYNLMMMK